MTKPVDATWFSKNWHAILAALMIFSAGAAWSKVDSLATSTSKDTTAMQEDIKINAGDIIDLKLILAKMSQVQINQAEGAKETKADVSEMKQDIKKILEKVN